MNTKLNPTTKFCANCGTLIIETSKYCQNCGNKLELSQNTETLEPPEPQVDKSNFFYKYKPGVILFCVITFFMLLFPPVEWGSRYSNTFRVKKTGYHFLLNFANSGRDLGPGINEVHINLLQLFVQIILVAIISIIFQYYNAQIIKWWKSTF